MKVDKIDRRVVRTKALLKSALRELMAHKAIDSITIQEISRVSTVNRATFYKHYVDKRALLEGVFQEDLHTLLEERTREMKELDRKFIRQIILAVSEFLLRMSHSRPKEHHVFVSPVQRTVQQMIVDRLLLAIGAGKAKQEGMLKIRVKAAMAGSAIYAAVSQWVELSLQKKLERKEATIENLVDKILDPIAGLIR
jgi:AcrR family transcriptional regulator